MRQFVSTTHADPEVLRRYAAGEASFDDIAEDMGPRRITTIDIALGGWGASHSLRKVAQERSAFAQASPIVQRAAERRAARFFEDASVFEAQLQEADPNDFEPEEETYFSGSDVRGFARRRKTRSAL